MTRIIGLTGARGAGKDTVAKMLASDDFVRTAFADALYIEAAEAYGVPVDLLQYRPTKETALMALALERCADKGFVTQMREVFAKELDERAKHPWLPKSLDLFAADRQQEVLGQWLAAPRSPRFILQYWGTEYRRALFGDSYWRGKVAAQLRRYPERRFVITDVRFPDEADLLRSMGGLIIRVLRPALSYEDKALDRHPSEVAMLGYQCDGELVNEEGDAGLAGLSCSVRTLARQSLKRPAAQAVLAA